jgi:hypothetical protein
MDRHITYVGNSWNGREYDDTLWVAFADQLTLGSTPTVGAALVGAYGPYWARYAASDRKATEQAYTKALYGLPTQPLQHAAGGQAAVVATSPLPVALQGSPPTAITRELSLAVDVPQFAYEHSAAGTVVRPANGGTVLEEEGQPILPPRPAVAGLPTEPRCGRSPDRARCGRSPDRATSFPLAPRPSPSPKSSPNAPPRTSAAWICGSRRCPCAAEGKRPPSSCPCRVRHSPCG